VEVDSILSARGGSGASGRFQASLSGGGGGRILILDESGGFTGSGTINVSGGFLGGSQGEVTLLTIPEPASLNLIFWGLGSIALLDYAWRRSKRTSTPRD
jgi:hypothetical protein